MREFVEAIEKRADHVSVEVKAAESRAYGEVKKLIDNFHTLEILTDEERDRLITEMAKRFNIQLAEL